MIYEGIYKTNRFRYPKFNGRYTFGFNQYVDDLVYKKHQSNEISVALLPLSDLSGAQETLRMISQRDHEVLIVLPNDRSYIDEFSYALKIEKFYAKTSLVIFPTIRVFKNHVIMKCVNVKI